MNDRNGLLNDNPSFPSRCLSLLIFCTALNLLGTDTNKLNQRLKEMFKERITSFREAVYLLTGYKVDLYTTDAPGDNNTVEESRRLRLRSMYAESPDDSLLFQVIPGLKS